MPLRGPSRGCSIASCKAPPDVDHGSGSVWGFGSVEPSGPARRAVTSGFRRTVPVTAPPDACRRLRDFPRTRSPARPEKAGTGSRVRLKNTSRRERPSAPARRPPGRPYEKGPRQPPCGGAGGDLGIRVRSFILCRRRVGGGMRRSCIRSSSGRWSG